MNETVKILTQAETITECVNAEKAFLEKIAGKYHVDTGTRQAWKKKLKFKLN